MTKKNDPSGCTFYFWLIIFLASLVVSIEIVKTWFRNPQLLPDTPQETRRSDSQDEGNGYLNDTFKEQSQWRRSMLNDLFRRREPTQLLPPNNPYANQGIEPPPGMPNFGGQSQQESVRCFEVEDIYGNRGVECRRSN